MAPSCVAVGQLASQKGVVWAIYMCGVLSGLSLKVPSLASVLAISFMIIPQCAYTLCIWIVSGVQ